MKVGKRSIDPLVSSLERKIVIMMGRAHLIISTGVTLSVMGMSGVPVTLPAAAVALVSALLPDIDEPNSLLVRKAIPSGLLRILQLAMIGAAIFVVFYGKEYAPGTSPWPD